RADLVTPAREDRARPPGDDQRRAPGDREISGDVDLVQREHGAADADRDRHLRGHRVHDRVRESERRQTQDPALEESERERLRGPEVAPVRAENEPEPGHLVWLKTRVGHREPGGDDRELARAGQPARLALRKVGCEIADLGAEATRASVGRESLDRSDRRAAPGESVGDLGAGAGAERAHAADPGDDDTGPRATPTVSGWHRDSAARRRAGTGGSGSGRRTRTSSTGRTRPTPGARRSARSRTQPRDPAR